MGSQATQMDFAIFWLPLIASVLLGGLSFAAWYGGNQTLAIWVGFAGAICFLLTAALQLQQYVWRIGNQPKVVLLPPKAHWFLRWDPPASYQMQVNDQPAPPYGAWKVPVLKIRNIGSFAQDGAIKWSVTPFEIKALTDSAPRLQAHQATFRDNRLVLGPKPGTQAIAFEHPMQWSGTVPLPFITRETETFIPLDVWENAALFFLCTMPDGPSATSPPFFFDAQLKWNIPEGGEPRYFRVKAVAANATPPGVATPEFLARIDISISEVSEK